MTVASMKKKGHKLIKHRKSHFGKYCDKGKDTF